MEIGKVLSKFQKVKRHTNGEYSCLCPAHPDKKSSLNITTKENKILLCCHVGCRAEDIVSSVGLKMADLFLDEKEEINPGKTYTIEEIKNWPWTEKVYLYPNKENQDYMLVVRMKNKDFRQYAYVGGGKYKAGLNKKTPVLYRLPEIIEAIKRDLVICITEGEKDADNIVKHFKMPATTIPGGCGGGWRKSYNQYFKGAKIVLVGDNDDPGRKLMKAIAENLNPIAKEIRFLELPGMGLKCDISDWIDAGGNKPNFMKLIAGTQKYASKMLCVEDNGITFYTDTWNAERFVEMYKENIKYCEGWKSWMIWDGKKWKFDKNREVELMAKKTIRKLHDRVSSIENDKERKALLDHIRNSESRNKRSAMVDLARCEREIASATEDYDGVNTDWLFNVNNGTIDLKTCKLKQHDRTDLITKMVDIEYDENATCPLWEKFLCDIFNNDKERIDFIQRAVGYSLTASTQEQCMFVAHGTGANGKSTFISIVNELLGEYAIQASTETFMVKKNANSGNANEDVAALRGSRFVSCVETEEGMRFAEVMLKSLTGGDQISARFLYQERFCFTFKGKIWMACNHKPQIRGTDEAIWRRIRLIPFDVTIPENERDHDLLNKLKTELPGILAWAVRGCKDWQEKGLNPPESVTRATKDYKNEMDIVSNYLSECCILDSKCQVLSKSLYDDYVSWAEENKERIMTKKAFGMKLKEKGIEKNISSSGITRNCTFYLGVGLLEKNENSVIDAINKQGFCEIFPHENRLPKTLLKTPKIDRIDHSDFEDKNIIICPKCYYNSYGICKLGVKEVNKLSKCDYFRIVAEIKEIEEMVTPF